jgi:hypothetical protein
MEILKLNKSEKDFLHLLKTTPKKTDCDYIIKKDTIIYENDNIIMVYKVLDESKTYGLKEIIKNIKYSKSARSNGTPTQSAIFGSLPRVPNRNNYCRITVDTKNQKKYANYILKYTEIINDIYKNLLPDQHSLNLEIVKQNVVKDYIISDTPFTTVNFNVNHAIKYHVDAGNFKNVFSNVLIIKEGVIGGHLICPEYNIGFEQSDGALILFDGQSIIHGVTPIKQIQENGYRSSCVFYSLATMKNCYPYDEELQRAKKLRNEIESRWRSDPNKLTGYKKFMKNQKKEQDEQNDI